MEVKNYFTIDTGAYFADEKPVFVIIQETEEWKVYYASDWMGRSYNGTVEELKMPYWSIVTMDIPKLKRYMEWVAMPEKWRNFTKAFKEKHNTDCVLDGPHLAATWMVEGKKVMDVYFYGILESDDLHPHFHKASLMLEYLLENSEVLQTNEYFK